MVEGKFDDYRYDQEETKIIYNRIQQIHFQNLYAEYTKPLFGTELEDGHKDALYQLLHAYAEKDWEKCGFSLDVVFSYLDPKDVKKIDFKEVDCEIVVSWFEILMSADYVLPRADSSASIFADKIIDQFVARMPAKARLKMKQGFKRFFPELHTLMVVSRIFRTFVFSLPINLMVWN